MDLSGNQVFSVTKEVQKQNVFEDRNKGLATCITFDETVSESLWENKVEECLVESTVELSADDGTNVSNFPDFQSKRESFVEEFDNSSWIFDGKPGTRKISDTDGKGSVCEIMHKMEETTKCATMIKVIHQTEVIETTRFCEAGNGIGNERGFMVSAKHAEGDGHKSVMNKERDGKEGKRSRRRGKGARKLQGTDGTENFLNHKAEIQNDFRKKGDETKRTYSRSEMEALRFVDLEAQHKKWGEIYCGLDPNVAMGYDGLIDCNIQKHIQINFDPPQQFGKKNKNIPGVLGVDFSCCPIRDDEINIDPLNAACNLGDGVEGECSEEDDSEEDYSSIQRPAFVVTGEPNFDSGPPQDGFEYLRRVRWEAAQVPKVKVAMLERSKLKNEQTAYMPIIPDIEKCPENLLALKQWEDAFILDFSKLRLALSRPEESSVETSVKFPFSSSIRGGESSNQLPETIISEAIIDLITGGDESSKALDCPTPENPNDTRSFPPVNEHNASPVLENATSKSSVAGNSSNSPTTLSAILGMDSVARLSMLRKRIKLVENVSTLSRNDGAWLFALCAAIDTPLDADTCAALRCLLRKCASLRAGKSELDDEVAMLNILATITGKYFGQSEF